MKHFLLILFFCIKSSFLIAQVGGESVYTFLKLNMSSNYSALGGFVPSVDIQGANAMTSNPALVDSLDYLTASINYISYVAGIHYGSALYCGKIGEKTMLSGYAEFFDYGDFSLTDETANCLGNFTCKDHVLAVSSSRDFFKNLRFGATLKTVFSSLETYKSSALSFDFGILYYLDNQMINFALTAADFGFQLKPYTENNQEKLPFDLRFSFSKMLAHAPFRFAITMHNLQKPTLDDDFLTSFANHFILSTEIFPQKVVSLKAGFNFMAHNDLYISDMSPFPGFSFGIDVRVKKFSVQYSRQSIAFGSASNLLSIELFFNDFKI